MASSASPPTLYIGKILPGKNWQYKLTEHFPSGWGINDLFKAEILRDTSGCAPKWAAIKTASSSMQASLKTELEEYLKPNVSSCQSIRPLFDVITTIKDEPMSEDSIFNEDAFVYELPPGSHHPNAEAIAQPMRIYPDWIPNPIEGETSIGIPLQEMFAKAGDLKPHLPIAPLEEQLEGMSAPQEVKDMLRLLLSLDQEKRSSAAMILKSKEYIALSKADALRS
ncbi:hypothetical protein FQN52_007868 [Onygenales sp. PD_12]|nr:hypothetical protein FQN53_002103 [Emmonsiellopsis sp. PD_33]KAK2786277.1 hypothetical protein FQN52_007868 [Onygenales sp. PD_12]